MVLQRPGRCRSGWLSQDPGWQMCLTLGPSTRHVRPSPDGCHHGDQARNDAPAGQVLQQLAPVHRGGPQHGATHHWPNRPDRSPHSRSGGCHSSHTHKNALADQTGFRFGASDADNHDRRGRPGNTPLFPQSRPKARCRRLGVSPAGSQLAQGQRPPPDGRRRRGAGLGNRWRCARWLCERLENLPNLGATSLSRRERDQTTGL